MNKLPDAKRTAKDIGGKPLVGILTGSPNDLFAKDITDAAVQKNFGYALLIGNVVGLILAVYGSMSVIRVNSWIPILVYVLLALGYAFMLFMKPKMKE